MKSKLIFTALLVGLTFSIAQAQEQSPSKDRTFLSSNFYDNTFYKVMGGSSIHNVLTENRSYYNYTPSTDFSIQGGKQLSKISSIYLNTAIQRYYRQTGYRPRILFGEADLVYSMDITNMLFGYNPNRILGLSLNAGGGFDVIRTFGDWTLGSNVRGGASIKLSFNDKFALVVDPYCKYMTGHLAKEFTYNTKVFEYGALAGFQYTVFDKDRKVNRKQVNENLDIWNRKLDNPSGSAAENSYYSLTAGSTFRMGTKKRYRLSHDFGMTIGHRIDKLNSLNLGLLYEGYQKKLYGPEDDITNPQVRQAEFNVSHNINLTNAFYGYDPDNNITFSSVEGIGFDVLSDKNINFGMNIHAGVEMDVRMSDHLAFTASPMFKLWKGNVNFREMKTDFECGAYLCAGIKYNVTNPRNKNAKNSEYERGLNDKGFDATQYSLQKRYNPNEVIKERVYAFDGWTIQLTGGLGFLNQNLSEFKPEWNGYLAMERRFGNFQWIQFGYGMAHCSKREDGTRLMNNELDLNYRFSITNFINGIDNNKVLNVSVLAGSGLDFSYLENDKTNIGTHLLLGLDLGYKLSDNTRLIAVPNFRLMTDNMDHQENWKSYDSYYGLSLGVRVDL